MSPKGYIYRVYLNIIDDKVIIIKKIYLREKLISKWIDIYQISVQ
ncbi:hypothetical protein F-liban_441 [Faustovirus]|nr:hypothetical protein F-liban_441 [Faustovirus]